MFFLLIWFLSASYLFVVSISCDLLISASITAQTSSKSKKQSFAKSALFISLASLLGGIVTITVIGLLTCLFRKKKNDNSKVLFKNAFETVALNLKDSIEYLPRQSDYVIPYDMNWEVDSENIQFQGMLGEGAFGRVMLAIVCGLPNTSIAKTVAVKMLKGIYLLKIFSFFLKRLYDIHLFFFLHTYWVLL